MPDRGHEDAREVFGAGRGRCSAVAIRCLACHFVFWPTTFKPVDQWPATFEKRVPSAL